VTGPAAPERTALAVVFNHRYEANIPVLEELYASRFPNLHFLVPFYRGSNPRVVPVYESSYTFQGYVAQSASRLLADGCTHVVFAADDLVLNPRLDAANFSSELGLAADAGYVKEIAPVSRVTFEWTHLRSVLRTFEGHNRARYVEHVGALPPRAEAEERFRELGLDVRPPSRENLRGYGGRRLYRMRDLAKGALWLATRRPGQPLPYPLATGYSDFFVVPTAALADFAHVCGVFAAMNLFVEAAIPTALALTCPRLVTEEQTSWRGLELWHEAEIDAFATRHEKRLDRLLRGFASDQLYVHPVKLSRWTP
jgi:hypothetical protein